MAAYVGNIQVRWWHPIVALVLGVLFVATLLTLTQLIIETIQRG